MGPIRATGGPGRRSNQERKALAEALGIPKEGIRPMSVLRTLLASLRRDEDGQGLAEYALILALIAIVAIIALIFLGGQVSQILSTVGSSV
jgi:pilus assembly protein Flp/PilA